MPAPACPHRFGDWFPALCGSLVLMLGGVVMLGWLAHSPTLVQVLPGLVPMQFNNALSLAFGGAALLLHLRGLRRLALAAVAVPLFFGATALIQTYGGTDLHVDRLFVEPFTEARTEFPGRMSVNSAVTHLLAGTALGLLLLGPRRGWALLPAAVLAAGVIGISLNALFGYAAGVELAYGWTRHSQMALHTATGILLISLGVFGRAWYEAGNALRDSPAWVAIPVLMACLLPSVGVWQVLREHEERQARRVLDTEAAATAQAVTTQFLDRVQSLERMAQRLRQEPRMPRSRWEADALNYVRNQAGYQSLERIDAHGNVRWVVPLQGNESRLGVVAAGDSLAAQAMELARVAGVPVISPLVRLPGGDAGVLLYVPVSEEGEPAAMLGATFHVPRLLAERLSIARLRGYEFALSDGQQVLFQSADPPRLDGRPVGQVGLHVAGRTWNLRVWPSPARAAALRSAMPELALALSLLLTLLLGVTVHYGRSARAQSRSLAAANERLTSEIAERGRAEERFRTLVESTPAAILMVNAAGRIGYVNSQALEWFGYRREELLGEPVEVLMPHRMREQHGVDRMSYMIAPRRRRMGSGREFLGRCKDGSEFPVDVSLAPLHTSDGVQVLAAITDMTAHKRFEQELRRSNDAMRAVNHELESFAYAVSHDLRQPLRAMAGFSQILQEDYAACLDDQGRDYLARVQGAANRMGELIDALLRLSRITRAPIEHLPVDLTALAWELVPQLEDAEPGRSVSWAIAEGMSAMGDREMLRVLLQNLLGNAWKFTSQTEGARIEVGQDSTNGTAQFFVRDNGAGFDMSYADKLFGAFQRLHGVNEFPGTGIGLATAQRIAHRHGGRIWAEGVVGAGATFHFTL